MLKTVLRELREQKGLPQSKIAEILGVSPAAYSTYEMGTRDVSSDKVVTLAKFYGVTTDYLYGIEDRSQSEISFEELKYIKKYRTLDEYGKQAVDSILNIEYNRCTKPVDAHSINIGDQPEKTYTGIAAAYGGDNRVDQVSEKHLREAADMIWEDEENED